MHDCELLDEENKSYDTDSNTADEHSAHVTKHKILRPGDIRWFLSNISSNSWSSTTKSDESEITLDAIRYNMIYLHIVMPKRWSIIDNRAHGARALEDTDQQHDEHN
jgi:hypothetical protein